MTSETSEIERFVMPLPKDLDDWVIVRTNGNERFIGRPGFPLVVGEAMTLSPAYEYLQQVAVQQGRIQAPMRLLLPLEMQAGHRSVTVQPLAITYLREATASERKQWLDLIKAAEDVRKQISLAQIGFVAASKLPPNGMIQP